MSDTPAPVPVAPDVAPEAPPVDAPIDLDTAVVDESSKLGKELARMRATYKPWEDKVGKLAPEARTAVMALLDGLAAGDQAGVESWLEQSLVQFSGPDRIQQIAQRYGQTSTPIGQNGRQPAPATTPAQAVEDDGPLTTAKLQQLLDQREQAAAERARSEREAERHQEFLNEIVEEIIGLGVDPDSSVGRAVSAKAYQMEVAEQRRVSMAEAFEAWKVEVAGFLNPPTVPEGQPSAVAPNGAPAANPQVAKSGKERAMERIQALAYGPGGPVG
jgi:hypothetical protein